MRTSAPFTMSEVPTRGASLGSLPSKASIQSFPQGSCESPRGKMTELAQAMLSEIEDMVSEYDADLGRLCIKSQCGNADLPDTPRTKAVKMEPPLDLPTGMHAGRLRNMTSRGQGGSQSCLQQSIGTESLERQVDRGNLVSVASKLYKLLTAQFAPKLQTLMKEVGELRRQKELLADKMEQQRQLNNKQMEEFEELQSELRVKNRQLVEQRRVSKDLDIYQGENAMLKMELKNLRTRVEQLGGRKAAQPGAHRQSKGEETPWRKTATNDFLKQEIEDLQREVTRLKTESSEKDVLISELKGVVKSMTATESPRTSMQRKVTVAPSRTESALSAQSMKPLPDAVPLVWQVGGALSLDTPRGRFRSIVMQNLGSSPRGNSPEPSLAEDLEAAPATTGGRRRSEVPFRELSAAAAAAEKAGARRGSLLPPAMLVSAPKPDAWKMRDRFEDLCDAAMSKSQVEERLQLACEALEQALFRLEDSGAAWGKKQAILQEKAAQLERTLAETRERVGAASAEVEGLRAERLAAARRCQETQQLVEAVRDVLRLSQSKFDELKAAYEEQQEAQLQRAEGAPPPFEASEPHSLGESAERQNSAAGETEAAAGDEGPSTSASFQAEEQQDEAPDTRGDPQEQPVAAGSAPPKLEESPEAIVAPPPSDDGQQASGVMVRLPLQPLRLTRGERLRVHRIRSDRGSALSCLRCW
ncbi:hypothetical protein Efla_003801 [Eimeria flavescens]